MNKKQAIKQRQAQLEQEIHAADILKGNLVSEEQSYRTTKARRTNTLEEQVIASHEARIDSLLRLLKDGYQIVEIREAQIAALEKALEEQVKDFHNFVAERNQDTKKFKEERDAIHDAERRSTDALHKEFVDKICVLYDERAEELIETVVRLEEKIKELERARGGATEDATSGVTESTGEEIGPARTVLVGEDGGAKARTQRPKSGVATEDGKILRLIEKGKQEKEAKKRGKSEEMSEERGGKILEPVEKEKQEKEAKKRRENEERSDGRCVVS